MKIIYIYIKINYWSWIITDKNNLETNFYAYDLYKNNDRIRINNLNEIPKFWFLSNNELKFYSENDLQTLSTEVQSIFKELEQNPTIFINWINYSK